MRANVVRHQRDYREMLKRRVTRGNAGRPKRASDQTAQQTPVRESVENVVCPLFSDWARAYGHPIYFVETFVDPQRFRGTCYLAANWMRLGMTTGRGKDAPSWTPNRSVKEVLGYPLSRDFRQQLCAR